MAVIALASASGSPGVTTTALGLALSLASAGAAGGGRPDRWVGDPGRLLPRHPGVRGRADRAGARPGRPHRRARRGRPADRRLAGLVHRRDALAHPGRRRCADLWEPLAEALADLEDTGQDVIIDAGRLGLVGSPGAAARRRRPEPCWSPERRCPRWRRPGPGPRPSGGPTPGWRQPGVLLVGEGQPYRAGEVTKVLGLPVVASAAGRSRPRPRSTTAALPPPRRLRLRWLRPRPARGRRGDPGPPRPRPSPSCWRRPPREQPDKAGRSTGGIPRRCRCSPNAPATALPGRAEQRHRQRL